MLGVLYVVLRTEPKLDMYKASTLRPCNLSTNLEWVSTDVTYKNKKITLESNLKLKRVRISQTLFFLSWGWRDSKAGRVFVMHTADLG